MHTYVYFVGPDNILDKDVRFDPEWNDDKEVCDKEAANGYKIEVPIHQVDLNFFNCNYCVKKLP